MKPAVLLFCIAATLSAQNGLTGKWDVTATPEKGNAIKLDASLKQEGAELSGTVNSMMGSGPVKNAVIGNPDLTFQFMIGKYTFDVKAVVEGEQLKGTFSGPRNMHGAFLAKRTEVVPTAAPAEGVEVGAIGAAQYRIDIPKNFNGSLVLYCHGYSPAPGKFDKDKPANDLMKAFLALGYAVAQSGYSAGGWAVKEGMEDTEALRRFFIGKYGKPKRTFVTGHSMGGTITLALAETFPDNYDAALQMCGPIGPTLSSFQRKLFDTLVVYDYYFPGIIGAPNAITDDVLTDPLDFATRLQKEMTAYPDRMEAFQKWSGFLSDTEAAQTVAFFSVIQKELMKRAGGNPFDNRNTLYQGSTNDTMLNRGVKRYGGDAVAAEYMKKYYTPAAKPKQPILTLHTTYDPLVPAWSVNQYGDLLRLNGGDANYVQRFVTRNGHCTFTPAEAVNAFKDLVSWKETGKRPEPGEQK